VSEPGSVQPANATPIDAVRALAVLAMRSTSSSPRPASAAAPAILKTMSPPTILRLLLRRARDVVGHPNDASVNLCGFQLFAGKGEVQDVARIVAEGEKDSTAVVGSSADINDLLRRWGREQVAYRRSIRDTVTDKPSERRVMPRAAPDDDRHLSRSRLGGTHHATRHFLYPSRVRVNEPVEHLC
jgi:hypothetical protein